MKEYLDKLRNNEYIREKTFGNISSFNFTKKAFFKGVWNGITTKARGLFINTKTEKIVARSYDKFFRIDELSRQEIDNITFPVIVYKKENGFLGILGYDEETDNLIIASKSSINGEYADYFKNLLYSTIDDIECLKMYLKENNCSMVFEVIDIENDPHIIEYDKSKIVLLDVIYNEINFRKISYPRLCTIANKFNFEIKEEVDIIWTKAGLDEFLDLTQREGYSYDFKNIEGFVLEDANGFMFKVKTYYYTFWKYMRGEVAKILTGKEPKIKNQFTAWVLNNLTELSTKDSLISIRKSFEREE